MNLMTLKEARQMAYENRRMPVVPHSACNGMVILDDRVRELEADIKTAGIQNSVLCKRLQEAQAEIKRLHGELNRCTERGTAAEARVQELEEVVKEQVETAYRAGIENMTYEYMKYLEAK